MSDDEQTLDKALIEADKAAIQATQEARWMDVATNELEAALQLRQTNRRKLVEWLWATLKEGIDYGQVAGQKPSLWQPGAEKICGYLGLMAEFHDAPDYARAAAHPEDVVVRCVLLDSNGRKVGEGTGAREKRQTAKLNDRIKMAQKSSFIDAVKRCSGLSEVFTQDFDDEEGAPIGKAEGDYLKAKAVELFGEEQAEVVLVSLAERRFRIPEGDWRAIPAFRLQDAVRSLEQKSKEGF